MELVLRRLLVRSRRRKPRPPMFWVCVVMLALFVSLAVWTTLVGAYVSAASEVCNAVVWWRALHSAPYYWDQRAFWRWWPLAMALALVGLIV